MFYNHFKDDLRIQSLQLCKTPRIKQNYNNKKHRDQNNRARKLLAYIQTKPNKTKAFYTFQTGNGSGIYSTVPEDHEEQKNKREIQYKNQYITDGNLLYPHTTTEMTM